jgi:FkbM family methyltransferase
MSRNLKPSFGLNDVLKTDIETIQILDVGGMLEGEASYAHLLEIGGAEVLGFEPNPKQLARLRQEGPDKCKWLPYFLGDGREATFHLTRYPGCSSLYTPDPAVIDLFHSIGAGASDGNFHVVSTETVQTKRLDDVKECPPVDLMKIDVQGGELDILRHSIETLRHVSVLQLEVEFIPLYKNQPLFGDLQVFLRDQGFQLHKFIDVTGRCFAPMNIEGKPYRAMSQALWADAIFVRDFTQFSSIPDAQLLKAATILHEVYLSYDLVLFIFSELDGRNGNGIAERYKNALQKFPPGQRLFMNLKEHID